MSSNPYRPSWGTPPPVLAGRDEQLDRTVEALAAGAHHPQFSRVYHGDRGTGKTVLLDAIAARWGFMADTICRRDVTTIRDRVTALNRFPR